MEVGSTPTKPRKVMVVADPTRESSAAVQYTLSHGVVDRDELILLQVVNAGSWRSTLLTLFRLSSLNVTLTGGGGDGGGAGSEALDVAHSVELKALEEGRKRTTSRR
ncbi:hypothetical protein MLD38_027233 [Melastoma candidum]|uniref:Uncharacterized protein n=1 Tax=Melastoma candidum TaxID=119954 RepID=A0ACB9P5R3_9MYRT|nr:hypothetical protein MLD38_027233 [Melastoma candidum]